MRETRAQKLVASSCELSRKVSFRAEKMVLPTELVLSRNGKQPSSASKAMAWLQTSKPGNGLQTQRAEDSNPTKTGCSEKDLTEVCTWSIFVDSIRTENRYELRPSHKAS
jgi:hypothetical protein